jgi:Cation transporter/ATPase, N-terminus
LGAEKVDEHSGLSSAEVVSRTARFGPNKFDAGTAAPRWHVFLRQYTDLMQIVLLVAGVVSLVVIATRRIDPDAPADHCLRPAPGVPQDHQPGCPAVADLPGRGAIHSRPIRDPEGRAAAYRTRP